MMNNIYKSICMNYLSDDHLNEVGTIWFLSDKKGSANMRPWRHPT